MVVIDGGSDDKIKVMTTLMGIDENVMKSVIVVVIKLFTNTSTLLTCRKRIMKHNTRRLTIGSKATILPDIVSSSQLVIHLSVRLIKEFIKLSSRNYFSVAFVSSCSKHWTIKDDPCRISTENSTKQES